MKNLTNTFGGLDEADRNRISRTAYHIIRKLLPREFTYAPFLLREPKLNKEDFENFHYVSLEGYESQYKQQPTFAELKAWINKHYEILCLSGHYIGYWIDDGIYYLDVSIAVYGKARALAIASTNKQLCIYHPASKRPISVPQKPSKVS